MKSKNPDGQDKDKRRRRGVSLVDWGRSVHRRLTDKFCQQRIVFHHVPKCGGTSVGRSLRRAYILSQSTVTPEESIKAFNAVVRQADRKKIIGDELEFRELMLLYLLYSDVRCVSAHIPFSDIAYEKFHDKYLFVTLLRDPIERFVSHYSWSHSRPNAHGHISEEFEDFLSTPQAKILGSAYVRYFCGRPGLTLADVPKVVEVAVRNLRRLDHVGFLDEVARFQGALRLLTGKRLTIGHENVGNPRSMRGSSLEGRLKKKVLDVCAPDREIWEAVQDLRSSYPDGAKVGISASSTDLRPTRADT